MLTFLGRQTIGKVGGEIKMEILEIKIWYRTTVHKCIANRKCLWTNLSKPTQPKRFHKIQAGVYNAVIINRPVTVP